MCWKKLTKYFKFKVNTHKLLSGTMMLRSKMAAYGHYVSVTSLLMLAAIGYFYSKHLNLPAGVQMQVKVWWR